MENTEAKTKDLEQLKKFIQAPKVYGFVSNLWYHHLRTKYPYEFICLMKNHRNFDKCSNSIFFDENLITEAEKQIKILYTKFLKFNFLPPVNEKQKQECNRIAMCLEDFIKRLVAEN